MLKNDFKKILCYILTIITVFTCIKPENVYGFGYVADNQTEFETGDILEPGKTYHINTIKLNEDAYDENGNAKLVKLKKSDINSLHIFNYDGYGDSESYADMTYDGYKCADISETNDGFDATIINDERLESDNKNYIIDAIRKYFIGITYDYDYDNRIIKEYNLDDTYTTDSYFKLPTLSYIKRRDGYKYLSCIYYTNKEHKQVSLSIDNAILETEEDDFGERIKSITLPSNDTFVVCSNDENSSGRYGDPKDLVYTDTGINKLILPDDCIVYKSSKDGIKITNELSEAELDDLASTSKVENWYDENNDYKYNGDYNIDCAIKINTIKKYLKSITYYNSNGEEITANLDELDLGLEYESDEGYRVDTIALKNNEKFYAYSYGLNKYIEVGSKIRLDSYYNKVYLQSPYGETYKDNLAHLVGSNGKPLYNVYVLCHTVDKDVIVQPNLKIGDTFKGGTTYAFLFCEASSGESYDNSSSTGNYVNGNYFGSGGSYSDIGYDPWHTSCTGSNSLNVSFDGQIHSGDRSYYMSDSYLDASYLFFKGNDTILSTPNGDELSFEQVNNLSYTDFFNQVCTWYEPRGNSVCLTTIKFPDNENGGDVTWTFQGCKGGREPICYFTSNSSTCKVEYYNRRDTDSSYESPKYTKVVNNGDSFALTDDEKQLDCLSDFTFDKYYDKNRNEIDIENTRAHSIVEKVYLADKYCYVTYKAFDNTRKIVHSRQLKKSELSLSNNNYTYRDENYRLVNLEKIQTTFSGYNLTKFYDSRGNVLTSEDTNQDELYTYVLKDNQVMVQYKSTDGQIIQRKILNKGDIASKLSKSNIDSYNDYESYNLDKYYSSNTVTDATTLVDMSQPINEDTTLWFKKDVYSVTYKDKRTDEPIYVKEVTKNGDGHLTEEEINNKDELKDYKTDKYYESKDSDEPLDDNKLNNVTEDTTVYLKDKYCYVTYKDKETTNPIAYAKVLKDSNGDILKIDETDAKKYYDSTAFNNEVNKDTVFSGYDTSKIYNANNTEIDTSTIDLTNLDGIEVYVALHVHTPNDGAKENEIPATCTENGSYDWVIRCSDCNEIISSEARTYDKTGHKWGTEWQNIPSDTDIDTLINGAENKDIILSNWVDDDYHRLQIQYCTNTWDCVRGQTEKAYRLRVLRFEFVYKDDGENGGDPDGKPDVTVDVYEEPKDPDDEPEHKIGTIDTTVDEQPIVQPENPDTDDPYVPYIVTPKENPYDYNTIDERDYRIPTVTISVDTNHWKEFLNTITFNIFFKDTKTGTINYEFKNPSVWDNVKNISYIVTRDGVTYDSAQIKDVDTWTDGTEFTLKKEDIQKYVAYAKVKLSSGYVFYVSSDGMLMDSVKPTITEKEDESSYEEKKFIIEDNTKLDKVYVDDEEVSITLNEEGNKTEITVDNDGLEHIIKAVDKAGNENKVPIRLHLHTNDEGHKENEIAATCTQDGSYNWVIRCSDCNALISSESRVTDATGHNFNSSWQNISDGVNKEELITGAENSSVIANNWVDDNYHRLQIQYCANPCCYRGLDKKAYRLRVLRFDFKYNDDNDGDGKPDVVINVIEEPKDQDDSEKKIDELDTIVDEQPIVQPENPETEDPYVPYIVTPKDNPYDYDYEDERDYRIPTSTISVSTNYWKEFVNTVTFGIFFKNTETGTISYEFKNPNEWDRVSTISYIVSKNGQVFDINEIKNSSNWTEGTSFTLEKEDIQKYVAYSKIRLACGYEFYISSNGMVMDSVPPTIECQTKDDVILFPEEKITIEDNTKLDKVYIDGEEKTINLNDDGNKTEIVVPNDGKEHTIKAVDKAGNDTEKVIKFGKSDFNATVEGYIRDIDGNPVSGATVELHSTPRTTTTDKNGKFSFDNVDVDRHILSAYVNSDKIYEMSLALTPTYVQTELKEVKGTYKVASEFTLADSSILVTVNADECQNHTHGHIVKENEINATCTKSGGYDSVDYCPNCGCEYSRDYVFIEALGHIWDSNDWTIVNNPTQELFDNAENANELNFADLKSSDKVYKRLCHRAQDAYDIRVDIHSHTPDSEVKENEVPASCTTRGSYDSVIYCQDCHEELSREKKYTDALGHIWSDEEDWILISNPTETLFNNAENKDELNFANLGHNDKVYKRLCHRAKDAYKLQVVDHVHTPDNGGKENEVKPDCTHKGSYDWVIRCSECNEIISSEHHTIDALGHIWRDEDWKVVSSPSRKLFDEADNADKLDFDKLGKYDKVYKRLCNRYSDAYEIKVEVHTHTPDEGGKENTVNPTCTKKGSYDWVVRCNECNEVISSEHRIIDALGHIWKEDWQLISNPDAELFNGAENSDDLDFSKLGEYDKVYKRLCNRASDAYEVKVTPHTHSPADGKKENEVNPKCTEKGSYDWVVRCSECGDIISSEHHIIDALGHDLGDWHTIKEPTYDKTGIERRECKRVGCDYYEDRDLDKLVKPTPDPKPEPIPEPKPEPIPEPKPEPIPEPKPEPIPEPKPEPISEKVTIKVYDHFEDTSKERVNIEVDKGYYYSYEALTKEGYTINGESSYKGYADKDIVIHFYYKKDDIKKDQPSEPKTGDTDNPYKQLLLASVLVFIVALKKSGKLRLDNSNK